MRTLITLAALAASSNAFAAGCPSYDYFLFLDAGSSSGSTVGMGNDATPSCGFSSAEDVTYIWYGFQTATYEFNTFGSTYDTVIAVRDSACTELACNDDYTGLQSRVDVSVAAYTYYFIDVDGYSSAAGSYVFNVVAPVACTDSDADGYCDYDDYCYGYGQFDSDGDAVCDGEDYCWGNGQFDSDGDGVCDGEDYCWGYGQYDSDVDGVCDWEDYCYGVGQYDSDGDGYCDGEDYCWGIGQYDSDGEGVCDPSDVCWGNDYAGDADFDGLCNDLDFTLYADTVLPSTAFGLYAYNAPAGSRVFFLAGGTSGFTCHPNGAPCVGIRRPVVLGSAIADGGGYATITRNGPPNVPATVYLQAAELTTPNSTNLVVQ